jgi:uncharacterized protein (DUF1330 family)
MHDPVMYEQYIQRSGEIFRKYKGEYMVVDNEPLIIEGNADITRVVMIRFDTEQDFKDWYYSEEYQEIVKYRLNASDCDTVLVSSLNSG